MDRSSHQHHEHRRLLLPSGREIEVMVFPDGHVHTPSAPTKDLHLCRDCGCDLVHPTDWDELGRGRWRLELRCPNCGWRGSGLYDRRPVEQLDEELERGMEAIVRDLRRLSQANMEEEMERFTRALRDDLILPMDF